MFVDTHCHIYKEYYNNVTLVIDNLKKNNIIKIINNGCDYKSGLEVLQLSKKHKNMYYALGTFPENFSEIEAVEKLIIENINDPKFIAIGEIGLDYYYNRKFIDNQKDVFIRQLNLAIKYNKPVIIHSRDATKDTIDILKKYKVRGVIHCFNGSVETATEYINLGFKLGIGGVVTFKNCKLIDVLKTIGISNIVFETDSPYLTPVPNRGKLNDPTKINDIVRFLSKELKISESDLAKTSNNNVRKIFDI